MTPEVVADWLRGLGHHVVRTESSYWFDQGPRVYQAFPYHWVIEPSEDELLAFMHEEKVIGLRYSTPLDAKEGSISYHTVYDRPTYDLKDVDSSIRSKVRRGLEACKVGPIPLERYAKEGWLIEQDTLSRQQRNARHGRSRWERMVKSASLLDGFEVWGAEVEGKLTATLMFVRVDDCIDLLYQQSLHNYLPLRVNNALLFETTKALVTRPGIRLIHNGLHSLDAPPSVDQFKMRMGYSFKPLRQRVVFNPRLAPFLGPNTTKALAVFAGHFQESGFLHKAEGLMRFHTNGKLPLSRQQFPVNLESKRQVLCGNGLVSALLTTVVAQKEGPPVQITPANLADLDELVALHLACFSEDKHFALKLGTPFIRDAYRWFLTSPDTLVLAARIGERIVGLTTLAKRPYNLPMIGACKWTALAGLLRRPWLILHPDWLKRLSYPLFHLKKKPHAKVAAQIAFTGIASDVQGRGIGQALKRVSIQACRDWGVEAIVTGVARSNHRAKAMNERAGFVEVPTLSSERLIHLRLELSSQPMIAAEDQPVVQKTDSDERIIL